MDTAIEVQRPRRRARASGRVLHGFTCAIPRGSVTGLLGPSGSGKTTLMRAIVGVQVVKSGTVTVLGQPAGSAAAAPHGRLPDPGAERLRRPDRRGRTPATSPRCTGCGAADADEAIADVGLAEAAGQLVGNLSGGQRSRASLACALVGQPEVLVLDEPTVGQDPVLRDELWDRFRDLAAAGTTVLVSSHVMDEAEPLRPAAADPRGRADRRRHPGRGPGRRRHRRPGRGVPAPHPRARGEGGGLMTPRILGQHDRPHPAASCGTTGARSRMLIVVPDAAAHPALLHVRRTAAHVFDRIALIMLGVFPFVIMFLVTSIAMLRERTTGTLERLLTTPLGKLDLLFGYGIAFGLAAAVQAAVAAGVAYWLFDLRHRRQRRAGHPDRGRQRRARRRARPALQRVRPHRVPGRAVHAGRGGAADCCCAGCSCRATRWPAGCRRSATCCRCRTRSRRCRRSARTPSRPARCGGTSAIVRRARSSLALRRWRAATLRRRSA